MLVCPGEPDDHIWSYDLELHFTVVTTNARDFIRLPNVEVSMNLPNLVQRTIHPELDALRDLQVPGAAPRPAGKHAFKLDVNSEVQGLAWFPPLASNLYRNRN